MKMPTIAELRNKTQIIAEDALEGILERFTEFLSSTDEVFATWQNAFSVFFEPVDYFAFLAFQGKEVWYDNRTYIVKAPTSWEYDNRNKKVSMPTKAHAPTEARFGGHRSPSSPVFPIDADMKIYFECQARENSTYYNERTIALSYNQLAGRCSNGRIRHWIENEYASIPANQFLADLNKGSWGPADPLYRKTPDGQKKVDELLHPGMLIEILNDGCSARKYIVGSVTGPHIYRPIERPDDHIFESYSLSMIHPESKKGGYILNSLVAINGEIKGLFFADDTIVEIKDFGLDCTVVPDDEDFNEDDELHCDCAPICPPVQVPRSKPVQLSLF